MKLKTTSLAALAAFTLAGPASAATLLFADNFNGVNYDAASFNSGNAASQGGSSIGTTNYTVAARDGTALDWVAQHGSTSLTIANSPSNYGAFNIGRVSLNNDFATQANDNNQALQFSFNLLDVVDGNAASGGWVQFNLGSAQNVNSDASTVGLGFRFQIDQGFAMYSGGNKISTGTYADGNLVTVTLTDTAGTGSAFNSNGSKAIVKIGATNVGTFTLDQQTAAYVNFGGYTLNATSQSVIGTFDNLSVTAIPEPGAALLGGLGMLCLLRRRR